MRQSRKQPREGNGTLISSTGIVSAFVERRCARVEGRRGPKLPFSASSMSKVVTTKPDEDAVGHCCASHTCAVWDIHLCSRTVVGQNVSSSTLRRVCFVPTAIITIVSMSADMSAQIQRRLRKRKSQAREAPHAQSRSCTARLRL